MLIWLLIIFIVAAVYSSTGLGGLPSLFAILMLSPIMPNETKIIALCINVILVLWMLFNSEIVALSKISDVVISLGVAIPAAMYAASYNLPNLYYEISLGLVFILTSIYIISSVKSTKKRNPDKSLLILGSAIVGLIVGLTGMSGGILLLPILSSQNWTENEEVSLFNSIFILLTSIAVLFMNYKHGIVIEKTRLVLFCVAALGGAIVGKNIEIRYITPQSLRVLTFVFLFFIGAKLIYANGQAFLTTINQSLGSLY